MTTTTMKNEMKNMLCCKKINCAIALLKSIYGMKNNRRKYHTWYIDSVCDAFMMASKGKKERGREKKK